MKIRQREKSNADPSFLDTISHPGTTQSLQDHFEKINAVDENQVSRPPVIHDGQRSHSLEDDLAAIRAKGDQLMRLSTQGFQLLWAKRRIDAGVEDKRNIVRSMEEQHFLPADG